MPDGTPSPAEGRDPLDWYEREARDYRRDRFARVMTAGDLMLELVALVRDRDATLKAERARSRRLLDVQRAAAEVVTDWDGEHAEDDTSIGEVGIDRLQRLKAALVAAHTPGGGDQGAG